MRPSLLVGLFVGLALLAVWFALRADLLWLASILGFACFLWFTSFRRR